jgi:hypothetical protein
MSVCKRRDSRKCATFSRHVLFALDLGLSKEIGSSGCCSAESWSDMMVAGQAAPWRNFDREGCSHDHVVGCVFGCRKGRSTSLHWVMAPCVLRVGLRVGSCFTQPTSLSRHSTRAFAISKRHVAHFASAPHFGARIAALRHAQRSLPLLLATTAIAGSALGISSLIYPSTLHCDGKCIVWMIHSPSPDGVYFKTYHPPELVPHFPLLQSCL